MFEQLRDRTLFFGLAFAFLAVCISLIFLYPDGHSFFIINGLHSAPTDYFFTYATYLGDGIFALSLAVLVLIFYKAGAGFTMLAGIGLSALTTNILKLYLFEVNQRPKLYFWGNKMIHYVDGVYINIEHSFPSGHTISAFFVFTFLVMLSFGKRPLNQLILLSLAIIAAYSRVYLAQHFLGDIVGGALIGITYALVFYKLLYIRLKQAPFFRKSLISSFNRG